MKTRFKLLIFICLSALLCAVFLSSCQEKHVHEFSEWITPQSATCTEDGVMERSCKTCSEKETKTLPALGHQPPEEIDCTQTQYCTRCYGVLQSERVHPLLNWTVTKNATCTEEGVEEGICTACGQKQTRKIYPLGHEYGDWMTVKAATCTEDGKEVKMCFCGKTQEKTLTANGHRFEEWIVLKTASCTEEGSCERHCDCGEKETQIIPVFHPYSETVLKEATRTEEGLRELNCPLCSKKFEEVIPVIVSKGLAYNVNADGMTCAVKGLGTCTDTEIIIPKTIDGYRVTAIADAAFANSPQIVEIVIPDTVVSIGALAFRGCSIKEIVIPDSVNTMGSNIFMQCNQLERVVFGNGLDSLYRLYGQKECLKSIVIGVGVTEIDDFVFDGYQALESVTLPEGLTRIGISAFSGCHNLKDINIPDSVQQIAPHTFQNCRSLTSITLPEGMTHVNGQLFANCSSLEEVILPSSILVLRSEAFASCDKLESIRFGGTVEEWGKLTKDADWCDASTLKTIVCSDGTVYLQENTQQ